jgi:hypothetical protein
MTKQRPRIEFEGPPLNAVSPQFRESMRTIFVKVPTRREQCHSAQEVEAFLAQRTKPTGPDETTEEAKRLGRLVASLARER